MRLDGRDGDMSDAQDSAGAPQAVLIAGPTASGKSALALRLAERIGGAVINADSMQVYGDLAVITARPTAAEQARAPHLLYGHVDAAVNYSVGQYVADAGRALAEVRRSQKVAIFAGGTGLYFKALTAGLAAVPPIPADIRAGVRDRLAQNGAAALHAELQRRDPLSAARLNPNDRTRVARALEVIAATGRSLTDWQQEGLPALIDPARAVRIFIAPDRAALYGRIDARFATMLAAGALDEVRGLAARQLDPLLPAMKAHGVPWLIRHLAGEISLVAAADKARQDTRNYAKRQFTWFRHQLGDWPALAPEAAFDELTRAWERWSRLP
jgi:tRNA dimethylallyltransferase